MRKVSAFFLVFAILAWPRGAMAWGFTGHRTINLVAMQELPDDVPPFLQTPQAAATIEALGPEMDWLKGSGYSWDHDDDPAHYCDVGDDHKIAGLIALTALPADMEAYAAALAPAQTNPYKEGYLPYSIADGWEALRKDFAYWRAFDYLSLHAAANERSEFAKAKALRESLVIHDIGVWGHFVGDGSQPLHATVHYNDHKIHALFEGAFVRDNVTAAAVAKLVPSGGPRSGVELISQRELLRQIGVYLLASNAEVPTLYQIARRDGFRKNTPEAVAFATARVADGARELRDLIVEAYDNSAYESVGYPVMPVQSILDGKIVPAFKSFGGD
ncbi:MAG: hypothetical protein JO199_01705 [Candidatus Eremiobacteraeota bacterium]|nr:hypothetical protein [Candidatus Eremiobacteraeota bacterium]